MLIKIAVVLAAYLGMEFVAWFTHKYIMHGVLWSWHRDHHLPHHAKDGFFERNDRFFLVFAIPSATCFILGSAVPHLHLLFYVGVGIALYGLTYFLIHDVYIHQRFKWFKQLDSTYSRAILKAHGAHHAKTTKEDCESFGLLIVAAKYFKENNAKRREKQASA
jgi:beta-carotene 3-hydroxylase